MAVAVLGDGDGRGNRHGRWGNGWGPDQLLGEDEPAVETRGDGLGVSLGQTDEDLLTSLGPIPPVDETLVVPSAPGGEPAPPPVHQKHAVLALGALRFVLARPADDDVPALPALEQVGTAVAVEVVVPPLAQD